MEKVKVLFLDRDGTLIWEPEDGKVNSLEKLRIFSGIGDALKKLADAGYRLVMISNQRGVGTPDFPIEDFMGPQQELLSYLASCGVFFEEIFICPHSEEVRCKCRKPQTTLLENFLNDHEVDMNGSYVIGDRASDIELARNVGCQGILLEDERSWENITRELL